MQQISLVQFIGPIPYAVTNFLLILSLYFVIMEGIFILFLFSYFCSYALQLFIALCLKSEKLATLVEGDPKAPFSIATTPRCRRRCYSIPWIAPLYP